MIFMGTQALFWVRKNRNGQLNMAIVSGCSDEDGGGHVTAQSRVDGI